MICTKNWNEPKNWVIFEIVFKSTFVKLYWLRKITKISLRTHNYEYIYVTIS